MSETVAKRVVFTNGCFDLLHVGHVRLLQAAREMGDRLIVGLNDDAAVRTLKGHEPINCLEYRVELLLSLSCVDEVISFRELSPVSTIQRLKPDVLVKGPDYMPDEVLGREYARLTVCLSVGIMTHGKDLERRIRVGS